jgi:hypothetical protein
VSPDRKIRAWSDDADQDRREEERFRRKATRDLWD